MSRSLDPAFEQALVGIEKAVPVLAECVPGPLDFLIAFGQLVSQTLPQPLDGAEEELSERLNAISRLQPTAASSAPRPRHSHSAKWRLHCVASELPDPWVNGDFHDIAVSRMDGFLCVVALYQIAGGQWQYAAFAVHVMRRHSAPLRCVAADGFAQRALALASGKAHLGELVCSSTRSLDRMPGALGARRGH